MENQAHITGQTGWRRGRATTRESLADRSDSQLIELLQGRSLGWKLAANELLRRHRPWLVNHFRSRLGNPSDAQDVVQQVLIRAWQAIERFQGRAAFRTWLYSIAENQCRTYLQQRMRYVQTEHLERLIELSLENVQSPVTHQIATGQAVTVILEQLGENAREGLLMRFFHDNSLEEIAAALSISLSAAKMRLYRALEQFRQEYLETAGA